MGGGEKRGKGERWARCVGKTIRGTKRGRRVREVIRRRDEAERKRTTHYTPMDRSTLINMYTHVHTYVRTVPFLFNGANMPDST